jgi:hypothetical protein
LIDRLLLDFQVCHDIAAQSPALTIILAIVARNLEQEKALNGSKMRLKFSPTIPDQGVYVSNVFEIS